MIVSNGWMNLWAFDEHGRKSQYNAHQSIEIRLIQESASERVKVHVCTDKLGRQNKFFALYDIKETLLLQVQSWQMM